MESNNRIFKYAVVTWGTITSLFHIAIAVTGYYEPYVVIPMHVGLVGTLGFIVKDWKGKTRVHFDRSFILDCILIIALFVTLYDPIHDPYNFQLRYATMTVTLWDKVCGLVLILLALELTRRAVGSALAIFAVVFLVYGVVGRHLPGVWRHPGFSPLSIAEYQFFTDCSMWSIVRIIALYVVLFIIFGRIVDKSKGGLLIQRVGNWMFGASPGGPAKVAVATSCAFGTITGSAVANVVTTGSFTIPMMKRVGYPNFVAGAIEAAASSGSQIMPPIMGAVAFVMADVLSISYWKVCIAAAVPAFLYYWALFVMVDMDARSRNVKGVSRAQLPTRKEILELIHLLIPVILLVGTLAMGYSVIRAGLIGIYSSVAFAMLRKITRLSLWDVIEALESAARTTVVVSAACIAAGIIVGIVNQTGLGLRLSGEILYLTHGYRMWGLVLIAFISLMLGMGMPTVPAYVITIAVGGTVLAKLGFVPVAYNMFILYFAVVSCITPPVMVASYAAAAVADADVWKLGMHAVKLAYIKYSVPFIFVYSPALLIVAEPQTITRIVLICVTAMIGVYALTVALAGYYYKRIGIVERILLAGAGFMMVYPGIYTDIVGFAAFAVLSAFNIPAREALLRKVRRKAKLPVET